MATTLYFRAASAGNTIEQFSNGNNDARLDGTAQGWISYRLTTTRGAAAATGTRTTAAGPTAGMEIQTESQWVSNPLSADVLISGTITFNLRMAEGNTGGNAGAQCVIERIDSVGVIQEVVCNSEYGTEMATSERAENWTVDATDTQFYKGDRIRIRVAGNDAGGTMGASVGLTFWYDGPTAAASGDSYVTFTEALEFITANPAGTVVYPSSTAAGVDPNGGTYDAYEAWTSAGASLTTAVVNTAAGWTAPLLFTTTAGANYIEWFTRGLQAVTLGGAVKCVFSCKQSNALANVSVGAEIAICANDGSLVSIWAATRDSGELDSSGSYSSRTFYPAGKDVSITNGQRLRLRVYADDIPLGTMATGYTATFGYNAASGSGFSLLTFTQTLVALSAYTQSVSVGATLTPALTRNIGKPLAITATLTALIQKGLSKAFGDLVTLADMLSSTKNVLLTRSHLRAVLTSATGDSISGQQVNIYEPGTTNAPPGGMFDAATGGSSVTNPRTTDALGQVEVYLTSSQNVDIAWTDSGGAHLIRARSDETSFIEMPELGGDIDAPSANYGRIFTRDNGAGKTQLCVRFPTGAVQVIATEP